MNKSNVRIEGRDRFVQKKISFIVLVVLISVVLASCGNDGGNEEDANDSHNGDDLKNLEVAFNLPETADVGEEVTLEAHVTYGDEKVDDADEVQFEYWKKGDDDNSVKVDADNNGDGTYTKTVTFEEDAIYEIYAHTTARQMHTMPKKSIEVGDVDADADADTDEDDN